MPRNPISKEETKIFTIRVPETLHKELRAIDPYLLRKDLWEVARKRLSHKKALNKLIESIPDQKPPKFLTEY